MNLPDIETLLAECGSDDPRRQVEAIQRLLDLNAGASVPALVEAAKSPDAVVRCTAAGALGHLGAGDSATAGVALMGLLGDPAEIVRSEAADALGVLRYLPAAARIRSLLLGDAEPLVRASAAETLGDLGDARALAELELALGDADEAVRGYAANSIGLLGGPAPLSKLDGYAASERSPKVRAELHGARYRLGVSDALDTLLQLLDAADEDLAANILNVLSDLAGRHLPPTLAADAPRIRTAVAALARRAPLYEADVDSLLARLSLQETT